MGELIVISDEFKKKLHPEARKVFHNWNDDVQRQVQIAELNDDDLKYLSGNDRIRLNRILEIPSYLNKCVDIKDRDKLYDVYWGDIFSLKEILGHTTLEMVNHYLHFTRSQLTAQHHKYSPMDKLQKVQMVSKGKRTN